MLEYLTLGEFAVATLMGLAALCAFVWGAAAGAFRGGEAIKYQVLRAEGVTAADGIRAVEGAAPPEGIAPGEGIGPLEGIADER
jgi:hypothetical protein